MRCILCVLSVVFFSYSAQSSYSEPNILTRSWISPDEHKTWLGSAKTTHSTMYLFKALKETDPTEVKLFDECLISYLWLSLERKDYKVHEKLKEILQRKQQFSLNSADEYVEKEKISKFLNSFLPQDEDSTLGFFRRPFSYFWPVIDLHLSVQKLRERSALAADYIDYLFKRENGGKAFEGIYQRAIANCQNQMSETEVFVLCAMHSLGQEGKQDLDLAMKEADKLRTSGAGFTSRLLVKLMQSYAKLLSA